MVCVLARVTVNRPRTTLVQVMRRRRRGVSRDANTYGRRAYRDRKVTVDDIETRATELYIIYYGTAMYYTRIWDTHREAGRGRER